MAPKKEQQGARVQIGIRLDAETLERIDRLREHPSGVEIGRADIARACILAGLDVIEKRSAKGR